VPQLLHREKRRLPWQGEGKNDRIEPADVVGNEDGSAGPRQPIVPKDCEVEERPGQGPDGETETAIEEAVQGGRSSARDASMPLFIIDET
jgi:hypothetical protein